MIERNYPIIFGAFDKANKGLLVDKDEHCIHIVNLKEETGYGDVFEEENTGSLIKTLKFAKRESAEVFLQAMRDIVDSDTW